MSLAVRFRSFIAALFLPVALFISLPLPAGAVDRVERVVLIKNKKLMMLIKDGEVLKAYKVSLGKDPSGPKVREGDKKTPEGTYTLDYRKKKSEYYLAIHISYPNEKDIQKAKKMGVSPGGDIELHGIPTDLSDVGGLHRILNWTDGCIAVTNKEMDEIWTLVADGTPIEIRP
ncbi:MAG: L,D-transpeptidase family protein [Nitrospirales bacterium]|nr:L,D-transpeptidase family protein [Nitrospirales bacterium]